MTETNNMLQGTEKISDYIEKALDEADQEAEHTSENCNLLHPKKRTSRR